jgi:predicted dehydrogenase
MISEFHLMAWSRMPEVEIVALCDRSIGRARERSAAFVPAARVYEDLATMLTHERLDFVDILTPPEFHYEHCTNAIAAGLHVICQKPLCDDLYRARDLVASAGRHQTKFAVHENHRYRPWFREIGEQCRQGTLGNLKFVRIEHLNATEPGEAYKNQSARGVWLEYGSHLVDMMRSLLGEPDAVYARMHRSNPNVQGESLAHATYEYADCTAVVEAGWKRAAATQSSVLVCGDEGEAWYEGTLTRGTEGRIRVSRGARMVQDTSVHPYDEYVESFYRLQSEFTSAMLGCQPLLQTGKEHLRTLACTFAAYDSVQSGEKVRISGWPMPPGPAR